MSNFSADVAIELWWKESTGRRVHQKPRKEYRWRKQTSSHEAEASASEEESSETELDLETWDDWFCEGTTDSVSD